MSFSLELGLTLLSLGFLLFKVSPVLIDVSLGQLVPRHKLILGLNDIISKCTMSIVFISGDSRNSENHCKAGYCETNDSADEVHVFKLSYVMSINRVREAVYIAFGGIGIIFLEILVGCAGKIIIFFISISWECTIIIILKFASSKWINGLRQEAENRC